MHKKRMAVGLKKSLCKHFTQTQGQIKRDGDTFNNSNLPGLEGCDTIPCHVQGKAGLEGGWEHQS